MSDDYYSTVEVTVTHYPLGDSHSFVATINGVDAAEDVGLVFDEVAKAVHAVYPNHDEDIDPSEAPEEATNPYTGYHPSYDDNVRFTIVGAPRDNEIRGYGGTYSTSSAAAAGRALRESLQRAWT